MSRPSGSSSSRHRHPRRRAHQRGGQEEQPAARATQARDIGAARDVRTRDQHRQARSLKRFFFQWEWLLVLIFVAVNIINSGLSPYYLNFGSLIGSTNSFLDMAFLVLPMTFVIILGNIDISVASTVALSAVIMAVGFNAGLPMPLAMLLCLVVSTLCGLFNGFLMVKFKELSAVIVTLSTMIIYRGIAYVILEDQAAGHFPPWFSFLAWGSIGPVPFILIVFAVCALAFGLLLHKTSFGRKVFAMGNNLTAARYSGIKTDSVIIAVSALTGSWPASPRCSSPRAWARRGPTWPSATSSRSSRWWSWRSEHRRRRGPDRRAHPRDLHHRLPQLRPGPGQHQGQRAPHNHRSLLILSVLVLNLRFGGHRRPAPPIARMIAAGKAPDEKA